MKNAIFTSTVFATLAAFVAADQTSDNSCWMNLGQYTTGGSYCVKPLPAFSDQAGCNAAGNQCQASYAECKTQTQSNAACLSLMNRCQILSTFCSKYCAPLSNGMVPSTCNLDTCNAWNGIDTLTPSAAPSPINQAAATSAQIIRPSPSAALVTPDVPCGQCFTEGQNGKRAFESGPFYAPYGTKMTVGICMATCQGAGYKYTGVEYGSECWCGNSFLNGAQPSSQCNMPCPGDNGVTCGGDRLMNVYQKGCAAPRSAPKSTQPAYVAPKASTPAAYNMPKVASTPPAAVYNAPKATPTPVVYNAPSRTSAAAKSTPTVGVCNIPSAYAKPVGGYHAPIVACNDDTTGYVSNPWKLYTSHYTSNCPTYSQTNYKQACNDACTTQYKNCIKYYAGSFGTYSSTSAYKVRRGAQMEKRTWWPFSYGTSSNSATTYGSTNTAYTSTKDSYSSASDKCSAQLTACKNANSALTVSGTCSSGGVYRAPSSQSGSNTYNSGSNSYGSYNTGNTYAQSNSNSYSGSSTDNNDYWKQ